MKEELRFLEAAVCIEDLQKASYKFSDQITSDIDKGAAEGELLLIIEPLRTEMTREQFSWVIKNLKNEINDQALRRLNNKDRNGKYKKFDFSSHVF